MRTVGRITVVAILMSTASAYAQGPITPNDDAPITISQSGSYCLGGTSPGSDPWSNFTH